MSNVFLQGIHNRVVDMIFTHKIIKLANIRVVPIFFFFFFKDQPYRLML